MKITYECETCGGKYAKRRHALACEALGLVDPATFPPVGLMVGDRCGPGPTCDVGCKSHLCGRGFISVVAISRNKSEFFVPPGRDYRDGYRRGPNWAHGVETEAWWFRGNGCGDDENVPRSGRIDCDSVKWGPSQYVYHETGKRDRDWHDWTEAHPCDAFWRAVKRCREFNIEPLVLRNREVVRVADLGLVEPAEEIAVPASHGEPGAAMVAIGALTGQPEGHPNQVEFGEFAPIEVQSLAHAVCGDPPRRERVAFVKPLVDESAPCAICGRVHALLLTCPSRYSESEWDEDKSVRKQRERLAELRAEINAQASDGAGFIPFEHEGRLYQLPLAPFEHWALWRDLRDMGMERKDLLPWTLVCGSGFKMLNDDPHHTDVMVGAGIALNAAYERAVDDDDIGFKLFCHKSEYNSLRRKGHSGEVIVLAGDGRRTGEAYHAQPDKPVPPGCIAIIPRASVEYALALDNAAAIVTQVGGALAHVVVVGRERGAVVVALRGALATFRHGERMWVDTTLSACGLGDPPDYTNYQIDVPTRPLCGVPGDDD